MSDVGWVGAGRLGLTCSLVQAGAGHSVVVTDLDVERVQKTVADPASFGEPGVAELVAEAYPSRYLVADDVDGVVAHADVVFVAVQTPHDPRYGGEQPIVGEPRDFEYGYLVQAVRQVAAAAWKYRKDITLAVVSTVLPGTTRAQLRPLLNQHVKLVYNPSFIAQGTVVRDYQQPEFVLLGADDPADVEPVAAVYRQIHDRPHHVVSIESAELLKVAYNCVISTKVVIGNMLMEIAAKTGADCDEVAAGLAMATERVASGAYFRGGMGDGGACHPRDNQAMSWLAERLDLSVDVMGFVSRAREDQSQWLAELVLHWHQMTGLPITVLGKAYKPNIALTQGSAGLLLGAQLLDMGVTAYNIDPYVDGIDLEGLDLAASAPSVFVVATAHDVHRGLSFGRGSVVIDPHGAMPDQSGVTVIRVGRKN